MSFTLTFERYPDQHGSVEWAEVPWDSALFGFGVYELRPPDTASPRFLEDLRGWLATHLSAPRALVFAKLAPERVAVGRHLSAAGFYLVETLFGLRLSMADLRTGSHSGLVAREATAEDLPALRALAQGAYGHDRLHVDPYVPREPADRRMAEWITRALADGDLVLVFERPGPARIEGYIHLRAVTPDTVYLSSGAVLPEYQGSGLGMIVVAESLEIMRERGFRTVRAHTSSNNLNALGMTCGLGFAVESAVHTLHWVSEELARNPR